MTSLRTANSLRITTPSRLHFGLFGFGGTGRQFGGVGAMVTRPGLRLRISAPAPFACRGPLAERAAEFARRWARYHDLAAEPDCRIDVLSAPRHHVGLGVGTQLGLAVAAGLSRLLRGEAPSANELARSVGRGRRSAVGTYGFAHGGLIVEGGKIPGDAVAPLVSRHPLPEAWRFALIRPAGGGGLFGPEEQRAFDQLPRVPAEISEWLRREAHEQLVPAVENADFDAFSESVYRFGRRAGECFAPRQGGAYNGPQLEALVDLVRSLGVRGVGQSSWGPTLFAVLPDPPTAAQFCRRFATLPDAHRVELHLTAPDNVGATMED